MDSKASWLGVNINPWLLCLLLLIVLYVLPWSLKPGSGPGPSLSYGLCGPNISPTLFPAVSLAISRFFPFLISFPNSGHSANGPRS